MLYLSLRVEVVSRSLHKPRAQRAECPHIWTLSLATHLLLNLARQISVRLKALFRVPPAAGKQGDNHLELVNLDHGCAPWYDILLAGVLLFTLAVAHV